MMEKLIFILFSFYCLTLNAQKTNSNGVPENRHTGFFVGYTAYLFSNPGFQIGMEKHLAQTRNFNVNTSIALQFYSEPKIQKGVILNARCGVRYTTSFGMFFENQLGIGYEHYFFRQKTFVSDQGVSKIEENMVNKPAFSPNVSFGMGYDFSKRSASIHTLFFTRASLYWRIPDRNLVFQNSFSLETGFLWIPGFKKSK